MPQSVTLTPLGGLGEIGMNCMLLETESSMIMIDCGLMFPDAVLYGVDVVIPRLDTILEKRDKLKGIVLTHGHEDHIGGLPWLLPALQAPIYGSRFTLSLVNKKLVEHNLVESTTLVPVLPRDRINIGDFHGHFFPVCHSI